MGLINKKAEINNGQNSSEQCCWKLKNIISPFFSASMPQTSITIFVFPFAFGGGNVYLLAAVVAYSTKAVENTNKCEK